MKTIIPVKLNMVNDGLIGTVHGQEVRSKEELIQQLKEHEKYSCLIDNTDVLVKLLEQ